MLNAMVNNWFSHCFQFSRGDPKKKLYQHCVLITHEFEMIEQILYGASEKKSP